MPSFLNLRALPSRRHRRRRSQQAPVQHEDVFQINEALHSSCSDLGDGVSEVTDSQANRPLMQDSAHPDGPLSHANAEVEEQRVEKATESEAGTSLGSRVPPELFENILFYVNVDRDSQGSFNSLERKSGTPSPNDTLTDLKQCSLVCLFWANRCRRYMFSGATLGINSYQDAEIFRRYVVGGCPRLTPVHQLIKFIRVTQSYSGDWAPTVSERQTSFLHLLHLPVIQDKFEQLSISGPVPEGFNPAKLDTPHWGIPPYTVVPSSFLPNRVVLTNVQFPSIYHIIKYIRHFCHASFVRFEKITWDGQMTLALPHVSNTITCQRRPRSLGIHVEGVCTDTVHLALTAVMMNPNCPLHRLSDEERVWMIKVVTLLWGDRKDPSVRIGFDVSEQATTMRMNPFYFIFEEALYTDRSVSALRVVGMHAYIDDPDDFPSNFDALVHHAKTHPTIRALVVLFDSSDRLKKSMKLFVEVLGPATEALDLVLAYEEEEEKGRENCGRVLGVDPVTLEPSGRIWADVSNWCTHPMYAVVSHPHISSTQYDPAPSTHFQMQLNSRYHHRRCRRVTMIRAAPHKTSMYMALPALRQCIAWRN